MRRVILGTILFLLLCASKAQVGTRFDLVRSEVAFSSDAPSELIGATNRTARGLIDPKERLFVVSVPIVGFSGFNSPLQQEHFNENYMVSATWADAVFSGRIIEAIDLNIPGEHTVRAKGDLTIRGVVRERIIPCKIIVSKEGIHVTTGFDVALEDHGIRVPKVVQQKIAPTVQVKVDLHFKPKGPM